MRRYLTQSFRNDIQELIIAIDGVKFVTLENGRTLRKQTETDKIHDTWDEAWEHLWQRESARLLSLREQLEMIEQRLDQLNINKRGPSNESHS